MVWNAGVDPREGGVRSTWMVDGIDLDVNINTDNNNNNNKLQKKTMTNTNTLHTTPMPSPVAQLYRSYGATFLGKKRHSKPVGETMISLTVEAPGRSGDGMSRCRGPKHADAYCIWRTAVIYQACSMQLYADILHCISSL